MTGPDPAAAARHDQAAAAVAEAAAISRAVAEEVGARREVGHPGPIEWAIIDRLITATELGKVTACPHWSPYAPQPEYWQAWAPDSFRCASCADQAYRRIKGTEADSRCDHCGKAAEYITECSLQMPPAGTSHPAVTVNFRLCQECQTANQHGSTG